MKDIINDKIIDQCIKLPYLITSQRGMKGFTFTKVYEDTQFYIYKSFNGNTNYELFKKKVRHNRFNNTYYEPYPSNESFGVWAWTYPTIEMALNKKDKINSNI
jgi:hypothetical protein